MSCTPKVIAEDVAISVTRALEEDIGSGDISAQLIEADTWATGRVISREKAVICGRPWVDEVFNQLDPSICIDWHISEGDWVCDNQTVFTISGNARVLLSGERCALNFLQTLYQNFLFLQLLNMNFFSLYSFKYILFLKLINFYNT